MRLVRSQRWRIWNRWHQQCGSLSWRARSDHVIVAIPCAAGIDVIGSALVVVDPPPRDQVPCQSIGRLVDAVLAVIAVTPIVVVVLRADNADNTPNVIVFTVAVVPPIAWDRP